ncbi:MAG: FlgD immunoglobulin-like domain containing protein [Bacteroidota bacterium]
MKKVLLTVTALLFIFNLLLSQTFYPEDGSTFLSDEVVSFDWYIEHPDTLNNNFYVYDVSDGSTVYAVYSNPSGQNHNDGQIFPVGEYKWLAKAWDPVDGLYTTGDRYFSVTEGITPIFSPDGETFHPNQTVSFDWYVPDSATANVLYVYDSTDAVVYETSNYPGGQQSDAGQKFANGTYTWNAEYTLNGGDSTTASYSFVVSGDTNVTVLEQYGIKWYIKGSPEYGQYTNGEYWIVGPITLVQITPESFKYNMQTLPDGSPLPSGVESHDIDRIINGSMVNPFPISDASGNISYDHGYDDELSIWKPITGSYPERVPNYAGNKNYYKEELNIARIDTGGGNYAPISDLHPRIVQPNSSIVSSISCDIPDRPVLEVTAILTVVDAAYKPNEGDFRPSYCGNDKKSYFNVSDLDYSSLKTLERAENFLSLEEVEGFFERNWIDYIPEWLGEFTHAKQNMKVSYGAEMASMVSSGAIALNTEYGSGTADKELLLKRMVQLGLDYYGVVTTPSGWRVFRNNGGLMNGRKFPVVLAGKVLNNNDMLNMATLRPDIHFSENDQTFYVEQSDIDITNGPTWSPDSRDVVTMPYETEDLGLPEWGIRHATSPNISNKYWETAYRRCCTMSSMQGVALAVHIMELKENWGHNAFLDYLDRYLSIEKQIYFTGVDDPNISANKSALYGRTPVEVFENMYGMYNMWDMHRANYGEIWTRTDTNDIYSNGSNGLPKWSSDFPDSLTVRAVLSFLIKMSDYINDVETEFSNLIFTISTIDSLDYTWQSDTLIFSTTSTSYSSEGMVYIEAENESGGKSTDSIWAIIDPTTGINGLNYLPEKYSLEQNYPNPFNPSTTIKYSIPKSSDVIISIYNMLGEKIATLIDMNQNAGNYNVVWNGQNDSGQEVSTGVYIYKINAGEFTQSHKMILLR